MGFPERVCPRSGNIRRGPRRRARLGASFSLLLVLAGLPAPARSSESPQSELPLDRIDLPEGFRIETYAYPVPGARSMTLSPSGTLFVGTRGEGKVYAVLDQDGDRRGETVLTLAHGLTMPNGVAFRDGALYVAEVHRVIRFDGIEAKLTHPPAPAVVNDSFPRDTHHGWKFIAFGPDEKLYVPVGAPCNVCLRGDPRYAGIHRMNPDGSRLERFASGVRNTVGFDWRPGTRELWFSDNGRDYLGDDAPPDELNRAPQPGLHFGFPHCHGGDIADPEYAEGHPCSQFTPPVQKLGAHVASLGLRFYRGAMFPERYRGQIFIAEHGSWNRSTPVGYRVSLVRLEGNRAVSYEPFATGWLDDGQVWGRPVDVLVMPDGSLLVSDDFADAIYRIRWVG